MLASFAASARISAPKSTVWRTCACGALAAMSASKNRCTRCGGGTAAGHKRSRRRGRN